MKPPDPLVPLPTAIRTDPPRPSVAAPVPTDMAPLLPESAVPVLKTSIPLMPAVPELALLMLIRPDDVAVPSPDPMLKVPPVFTVLRPA
jgi:hypothetical protein